MGRNPATVPMPIANAGAYWRFIFVSRLKSNSVLQRRQPIGTINNSRLNPLLLNIVYGISRRPQSLRFRLESRLLTNVY